ncbi:Gfo/Idh/MocA family oxidoreductase [Saccharopolyspora sp. NPDC050642]|uniref:Gfo/Idh/MocA family protein n=1 Tax=Saccharopolyspora sp. NPDC050642 TaxID=3157099 RepID=UPI0033E18985
MTALTLGIVGCGYVADFYAQCVASDPAELEIVAAYDIDESRARSFASTYRVRACADLDELLDDPAVSVVVNLTPPAAHADITERALRAGKHVFSEKPFVMDLDRGRDLVRLAIRLGLALGSAPAVHRSPAARYLLESIAGGRVGPVSHLYCDLDDGPLHRMSPHSWRSTRGVPWPLADEFGVGPVLHHLPYALTWAVALCGPVEHVQGHTAVRVESKYGAPAGPDLCIAVLRHAGGRLSRITVGALARRCRELLVVGEEGELFLPDMWSVDGPVLLDQRPVLSPQPQWPYDSTHRLNFDQGLRDMAQCLRGGGGAAFTEHYGRLALHVTELSLALGRPGPCDYRPDTTCPVPAGR